MDELIFFAVIIFFSIVESIARSRKAKRGEGSTGAERPDFPESDSRVESLPEVPTYDRDPSYDDHVETAPPAPAARRPLEAPRSAGGGTTAPSSSEVLLPGDLLQELERLAGRPQPRSSLPGSASRPAPKRVEVPPPKPVERPLPTAGGVVVRRTPPAPVRKTVPKARPLPFGTHGEHPVHLAHRGFGTDPSSRAPSREDNLDPLAEYLGEDAKAVRSQLRSRSASELRRAIILREVLGAPVALRDEPRLS